MCTVLMFKFSISLSGLIQEQMTAGNLIIIHVIQLSTKDILNILCFTAHSSMSVTKQMNKEVKLYNWL